MRKMGARCRTAVMLFAQTWNFLAHRPKSWHVLALLASELSNSELLILGNAGNKVE